MKKKLVKTILLDVFGITDLCSLCQKKGVNLPTCECMTDKECVNKVIKLYKGVYNECENGKENKKGGKERNCK